MRIILEEDAALLIHRSDVLRGKPERLGGRQRGERREQEGGD